MAAADHASPADGPKRFGDAGAAPPASVRRLSLYLRQLESLEAAGTRTVSSRELGDALDLTDAQVRKDLAYFGQFGHPGIGYRVPEMIRKLRHVLGTDRTWDVALVGAGNLGRALAGHARLAMKGFRLVAVFDADPAKVGQAFGELTIEPMDGLRERLAKLRVRVGIIAVPSAPAQSVADALVAAGVRGILNFAPVTLAVRENVAVNSVDLAAHLEQIVFAMLHG